MTDPLQALVVDEQELAREELAQALAPFVQLTKEGSLWFQASFDSLSALDKVRCVLLAVKALHLLGLRETEQVTPSELCDLSGMAAGTVRPKLSALLRDRDAAKSGGKYVLPPHAIRRAVAILATEGASDDRS
jgi:hypothetical protein